MCITGCLALALAASGVAAEEAAWEAPVLVPDNPVLERALAIWGAYANGAIPIVGPGTFADQYHPGTIEFWDEVKSADREGLVAAAQPIDSVGMTYPKPFTVFFPTREGVEEMKAYAEPGVFSEWDTPGRRVWVLNPKDAYASKGVNAFAPVASTFVVFKVDLESGEQPGVCHARQVIRVLYIGAADEAELASCLTKEQAQ